MNLDMDMDMNTDPDTDTNISMDIDMDARRGNGYQAWSGMGAARHVYVVNIYGVICHQIKKILYPNAVFYSLRYDQTISICIKF
jgi:hypothetical protein